MAELRSRFVRCSKPKTLVRNSPPICGTRKRACASRLLPRNNHLFEPAMSIYAGSFDVQVDNVEPAALGRFPRRGPKGEDHEVPEYLQKRRARSSAVSRGDGSNG